MKTALFAAICLLSAPAWGQGLLTPERVTVLRELHEAQHPWAVFAKSFADRIPAPYADRGNWDITAYLMTGDASYAKSAIWDLRVGSGDGPWHLPHPYSRNDSREYGWYYPAIYPTLRPHMSDEERAEYETKLHNWAKEALAVTRASDSDEVVGHYMLLAITDKVLGTKYLETDVPTSGNTTSPADMREQIRKFCQQAKGGEWIESSDYNLGTVQILLMGAATLGLDQFPEVQALLPELGEQMRWQVTADRTQATEWGDIQGGGHQINEHARLPLMAIVIGLGGDPDGKLAHLLASMLEGVELSQGTYINLTRALWVFDPRTMPSDPQPENPQGLRHAEGVGLTIFRQGETLWQVHSPGRINVDHQPPYATDIRVYHKGHWLIDHPLLYSSAADTSNTALFAGLGGMIHGGATEARETSGGFHAEAETYGTFYDPRWYNPPPPFAEWTRQYDGKPGLLLVTDDFAGEPPFRASWYQHAATIQAAFSLWQQVWHCPTKPESVDGVWRWTSSAGEPLRLATNAPLSAVTVDPGDVNGWVLRLGSNQRLTRIQTAIAWDGVELPAIEPAPADKPLKAPSPSGAYLPTDGVIVDHSGAAWQIDDQGRLLRNGYVFVDAPTPGNRVTQAYWAGGKLIYEANGPYWYDLDGNPATKPGTVQPPPVEPEPEPEPTPAEPVLLKSYPGRDGWVWEAWSDKLLRRRKRTETVEVEDVEVLAP